MKQNKTELNRRSFLKAGGFSGLAALGGMYSGLASSWGLTASEAAEIAAVESGRLDVPRFVQAVPVWAEGREKEMNVTLVFRARIEIGEGQATDAFLLRITGATIGKVQINGETVGYGPARGPHGWFRIDEWKIGRFLKPGTNEVRIEVVGYNSNSYYLLDQPSFLQAEIVGQDGSILAATAPEQNIQSGFVATDATGIRVQKVQRFSFQRPFIEVYDTRNDEKQVRLARQPEVKYLPRRIAYPQFDVLKPVAWLKTGKVVPREKLENPWRDRSLVNIGPELKGYKMDELDLILSDKVQILETKFNPDATPKGIGSKFNPGDFQIVDLGINYSGFFGFDVDSLEDGTELVITFDEILSPEGDVNFLRLGTCSTIQWTLGKGNRKMEAMEPEVGRYAKIHCLKGSFKLNNFYMRDYSYPPTTDATFANSDPRLEKLYKAAVWTFRENSVDVFTDCPHRERAGWLCDSFFTSRSAFDLTGKTDVEQVFYENYQLPEKFDCLPDGMLPMCYPADHYDGIYIPNWALWFVVQLEEYATRTPDRSTIDGLKVKIEKLMSFFEKYENADGLLEKLPSWVFVEWSAANTFVQDVNYPSNMLYAAALASAGRIYGNSAWIQKAEAIRKTIIEQSYDGVFFVDNALRKEDGSLEVTTNRSEVCQYFAYFFRTVTPESHPELWSILLDKFGPSRVKNGIYPEVHKANSFVGNVLRLEILSMAGRGEQLLEESVAYNEYMADRTGTLWENDEAYASCNHGFASHVCHVFYRDILGIAEVNAAEKTIKIVLPQINYLDWVEGCRPVPGGKIALRWEKKEGKLVYSLSTPDCYKVTFENASGLELVRN